MNRKELMSNMIELELKYYNHLTFFEKKDFVYDLLIKYSKTLTIRQLKNIYYTYTDFFNN